MTTNVLLVVLDSVRARNMSVYNHFNETTPFLESFTDEAVLYTQARAPGTTSGTSHASIFTGLHVHEHQTRNFNEKVEPGHTIWEQLRDEEGYATAVFSSNRIVSTGMNGLTHGFDMEVTETELLQDLPYDSGLDPRSSLFSSHTDYLKTALKSEEPIKSLVNGLYKKYKQESLTKSPRSYSNQFLNWLSETDKSWAACINYMSAHTPYSPRSRFDKWGGSELREFQKEEEEYQWDYVSDRQPWWKKQALESLYDGAIRELDEELKYLVGKLRQRGVLDDTLLVITSDHGEAFGERSNVRPSVRYAGHAESIHESLLHVPLIVRYPGQAESNTVDEVATLTRFPTVVTEIVDGDISESGFVPNNEPVIASSLPYGGLEQTLRDLDIDPSKYAGKAHAIYTGEDDVITKYAKWGKDAATIHIRDAQTAYRVAESDDDVVDNILSEMDRKDIHQEGEEQETEVEPEIKQRLEELGYRT